MSTTTPVRPAQGGEHPHRHDPGGGRVPGGLFDPHRLLTSLPDALRKLDPRVMAKSPVMFVVEIGSPRTRSRSTSSSRR